VADDTDRVFKALADPTRRTMLDRLRQRNSQTLTELCEQLGMARQSATQHLDVLEAANLISTVWRGRTKLHYLNPVPIHDIGERWIGKFERPRLSALRAIKHRAEGQDMTGKPTYVYVTYIESTPEKVWHALTDAELTGAYWGHRNVSDWQAGSAWEHVRTDGSGIADVAGTVIEAVPGKRLVLTFDAPTAAPAEQPSAGPAEEPSPVLAEEPSPVPSKEPSPVLSDEPSAGPPQPSSADAAAGPSVVTFDITPYHDIVRLTVTHENLASEEAYLAVSHGWPAVCANLKSLLETGHTLPQPPWEMNAELRDAQLDSTDVR
jgi:uncharacterized protein YndB with AHSA1/START domain/DNA-binding transcriptional ArsR family regulator